jgi:hypothetical protein
MKNLEHKETKETKTTTQPTSTSTKNIQNFFPRPGVLDGAGQKVPENAVFDLAVRIKTTNLTSVNFNSSTLTQATLELISTAIFGGNPTITSIDIGNKMLT